MKDYYQVLGVNTNASSETIKRAYRRLVVLYHPDRNPDPEAHEMIKEINEAYDVLSDEEKRKSYDLRFMQDWIEPVQDVQPPHRDPRYRRKSPPDHYQSSRKQSQYELMEEYLPYVKWFCYAGFLVTLLLAIDWMLPFKTSEEIIQQIYAVKGRFGSIMYFIVETNTGKEIVMYREEVLDFYEQSGIKVYSTLLYSTPMMVSDPASVKFVKLGYIYRSLVFMPALLFFISLGGIFFRKNVEFSFNLNIVAAILLIVNLYLIFHR